jgi:ribonuclease-3
MNKTLEDSINYQFKNQELLKLALTHSSFNEGNKRKKEDNENLEFLGDSVLNLAVTEYLFKKFKKLPEGELSKIKAHLISTSSLYDVAQTIDLADHILLGKGEEKNSGRKNRRIVASTFEALMGAVFLDSNYKKASNVILSFFKMFLENYEQETFKINDYKSELQEFIQKHQNILPLYKSIDESGKPPDVIFTSVVILEGKEIGRGKGKNKRQAEQDAAMNALKKMDNLSHYEKLSKVFFLKN